MKHGASLGLSGMLFISALLFAAGGCVRPIPLLPDHSFKLFNPFSIALHIDVYQTRADYDSNTNVFFSGIVQPYDSLSMKTARPDSNVTLYYDIYSDDYTATNWGSAYISFMTTGSNTHAFTFPQYNTGQYRVTYLAGNNAYTKWRAIDRVNNSFADTWGMLTSAQQYQQLIFGKGLTGYLLQQSDSGTIITDTIGSINNFFVSAGLCGMELKINNPFPATYKLYNTSYLPIANNYHATLDTILMYDNLGYWVMVKQ